MKRIALTVNGESVERSVAPRTSLADFLREDLLLTGTHTGCEQGICGACTVVIDGEIARSCITYAVACDGAVVRSIEGFNDDPLMQKLRQAFSEEHALQCGYCTPGMLIAARDLLRRKMELSDQDIRGAMSGNLCRCTGYMGLVAAVKKVMVNGTEPDAAAVPREFLGPAPGPKAPDTFAREEERSTPPPAKAKHMAHERAVQPMPVPKRAKVRMGEIRQDGEFTTLTQTITVDHPRDEVWRYMADIEKVATSMPGVTLDGPAQGGRLTGRLSVKLGPISASFSGEADVERIEDEWRGVIDGKGRDMRSASRAKGRVEYRLEEVANGDATNIAVSIAYSLAGPLAQFSRGTLVRDLVARLAAAFAQNLEARLSGRGDATAEPAALDAGSLIFSMLWDRIKTFFGRLVGRSSG